MATFAEIVYMCLDELKLYSGDNDYTQEHILFIASKLRAYLLDKKAKDFRETLSSGNEQEICIDLEKTQAVAGLPCSDMVLKSTEKIPGILGSVLGGINVYTDIFSSSHIAFVEHQRLPFIGSKWTRNMLYCTIGPDNYFYMKSANPGFLNLKQVRMSGIFSDIEAAAKLDCCNCGKDCDVMSMRFPLEDNLITLLVQSTVQELSGQRYMPKDKVNNSADDMAGQASATPRNINRQYVQQQQ